MNSKNTGVLRTYSNAEGKDTIPRSLLMRPRIYPLRKPSIIAFT
jgi:hypothetical protein